MPLIQHINEEHAKTLNSMKMGTAQAVDELPDIHKEVYDGQL